MMLSFAMTHCSACNKTFASGASLRTHRSRFHRALKHEIPNAEQTDLVWLLQPVPYIRMHDKITCNGLKMKGHGNTSWRFNPYRPRRKDQYQDIPVTSISILKNLTQSKKCYSFLECYILKHYMFDKLIPDIFVDESTMRKNMDEEDVNLVLIVRDLPNIIEVHIVLNEPEFSANIVRITYLFLEKINCLFKYFV